MTFDTLLEHINIFECIELTKEDIEEFKNSFKKDNFPVLIPQVYLHYDPKNQSFRKMVKEGTILTFQRMDFLIIYKGKRIIIEVDGETHTPEYSL